MDDSSTLHTHYSCSNCQFYRHDPAQWGQPYDEFYCTKNHWHGITGPEDLDSIYEETDCPDYQMKEENAHRL